MYRRQVSCRYCGGSGHNRSGCAKHKEYIKNNPDSYSAKVAEQKAVAAKHRRCSYCNNEGHNRKTCSRIMEDMIKVAGININFRKKFMENIIRGKGLAPGALVTINSSTGYSAENIYHYDMKDKMALVIGIEFNGVLYPNQDSHVCVLKIQYMDIFDYGGQRRHERFVELPNWYVLGKERPQDYSYYSTLSVNVVSPGHYDMDNEDEWTKNKEAIKSIVDTYNSHERLNHAIDRVNK